MTKLSGIDKELYDSIIGGIEDVMDRYEDRQFTTNVAGFWDNKLTQIIIFEIDGKKFTVTIQ